MKVIWSDFASETLRDIYVYYKETAGKNIANRIKDTIFSSTKQLVKYPNSGQIEDNLTILGEDHRYLVEGNYKIVYKPVKEGVFNTFDWDELERIPSVDVVVHLAGKAHDTKNRNDTQEYFNINVGLSQIIFQYFLESSATKFIFFSSIKAVADSVDGDQLTEEVLANPKTPYGKSKLEAENYLKAQFHEWTTEREHDSTTAR